MVFKFEDVGANKMSWQAECAVNDISEVEYDWLYNQVKTRGCVMSREIEFLLNKEDPTTVIIIAGFHKIGKFTISK